jgi:hypothetical protein
MRKHYVVHAIEGLSHWEDAARLDKKLNEWAATEGRLVHMIDRPNVMFAIFEREFVDVKPWVSPT